MSDDRGFQVGYSLYYFEPMNAQLTECLLHLLRGRTTAALGTLHEAAPFVSMVPYAIAPDGSGFVVHVSELVGAHQGHARRCAREPAGRRG